MHEINQVEIDKKCYEKLCELYRDAEIETINLLIFSECSQGNDNFYLNNILKSENTVNKKCLSGVNVGLINGIVENNIRQHEYLGLIHNHVGNHYLFSKLDMYNAIKIALYLYQKYHIRYFFNLLYCEEKIKINLFDVKIKKVFSMDYIHFSIENYKVISFEEYIKVIKTGR